MITLQALDASFARLDRAFFRDARAAGYDLYIADLWTGGYANNAGIRLVAEANLRDAQAEGFIIAGYSNANPWYPASQSLQETKANAGAMWPALGVVAVDLEIAGTTEQQAFALGMALEAEGKRVCVYTGRWVWERDGCPSWSSLARWPLWLADYDGQPVLDSTPFGPWTSIIGKQFAGSTPMFGKQVDLNVFDAAFVRPEEEAMPTIEELQARIDALEAKVAQDNNTQTALLQAWAAYRFAPLAHVADTKRHVDSAFLQQLDDKYVRIGVK